MRSSSKVREADKRPPIAVWRVALGALLPARAGRAHPETLLEGIKGCIWSGLPLRGRSQTPT